MSAHRVREPRPTIAIGRSKNLGIRFSPKRASKVEVESADEPCVSGMHCCPHRSNDISTNPRRIVIPDAGHVDTKLEDRTLVVEIAVGDPIVGRLFSPRPKSAIGDLL
jgi:hypothetical protein